MRHYALFTANKQGEPGSRLSLEVDKDACWGFSWYRPVKVPEDLAVEAKAFKASKTEVFSIQDIESSPFKVSFHFRNKNALFRRRSNRL